VSARELGKICARVMAEWGGVDDSDGGGVIWRLSREVGGL